MFKWLHIIVVNSNPVNDKLKLTPKLWLRTRQAVTISRGKQSDLVHFLKAQGKLFSPFPCTLFLHIFGT